MPDGQIVILNGAPRSGKSSIIDVMQSTFAGPWMNLGVDAYEAITPPRYRPGIGLRPGGERLDIETLVPTIYLALYDSIAAHSRLGLNVVTDVGHHDAYSRPLSILARCARRVEGLPVLFVGVRCSIDVIMERRNRTNGDRKTAYVQGSESELVPSPVAAWQREVHRPGIYDIEVDTTSATPTECANKIRQALDNGAPMGAFQRLAMLPLNQTGP